MTTIFTTRPEVKPATVCCSPSEPAPCVGCSAADAATAMLERGIALAEEIADEAPALDYHVPTSAEEAEIAEGYAELDAREHLDRSDRLTLAELVDRQADFYRSWQTPAGTMLAQAMDELSQKIRFVQAETPADYDARLDTLEEDARQQWYDDGYRDGRQHGRREARALTAGLID